MKLRITALCSMMFAFATSSAFAQGANKIEDSSAETASTGPFYEGPYLAPMGSFLYTGRNETEYGLGGILALGYRWGWYALEASAIYTDVSVKGGGSATQQGGGLYGLVFPFSSAPNLYGIVGAGALEVFDYPAESGNSNFSPTTVSAGAGYLWMFSLRTYDFALRTEALYRYGRRERDVNPRRDTDAPKNLNDALINIGLQLPLGKRPPLSEPEPKVVAVVAPQPPPDSDGDGVPDSTDACPDTDPGAEVDGRGCALPPPPPPCETPDDGESLNLAGCGVGDVIVLHGVNFAFDKARLTANAKTILDSVAAELRTNPQLEIEVGGYTDSRGTDSYNDRLSSQRASSVMDYLEQSGIEASRMSSRGYGESSPVADNETEAGRELNRRVELRIVGGVASGAARVSKRTANEADAAQPDEVMSTPDARSSPEAPAPKSPPPSADEDEDDSDDLDFLDF